MTSERKRKQNASMTLTAVDLPLSNILLRFSVSYYGEIPHGRMEPTNATAERLGRHGLRCCWRTGSRAEIGGDGLGCEFHQCCDDSQERQAEVEMGFGKILRVEAAILSDSSLEVLSYLILRHFLQEGDILSDSSPLPPGRGRQDSHPSSRAVSARHLDCSSSAGAGSLTLDFLMQP